MQLPYSQLVSLLFENGFTRIERDDRLLDIMPHEDREKGVELWEKDEKDTVLILRVRLPYSVKKLKLYEIARQDFENALLQNDSMNLEEMMPVAEGEGIISKLKV